MNKQEVLGYIDSGEEVTWRRSRHSIGDRVRLLGYGYRASRRWGDEPIAAKGATGVLVEVLDLTTGEPYKNRTVAQLRQLFPGNAADARKAEVQRARKEHEDWQKAQAARDINITRAKECCAALGIELGQFPQYDRFVTNDRTGEVFIKLSLDETLDIITRLNNDR